MDVLSADRGVLCTGYYLDVALNDLLEKFNSPFY